MGVVKAIVGITATLVIGGTAYTVNQADVVDNFAGDTGLTHEQAEQYVKSVGEEDLVAYDKIGTDYVSDGNSILDYLAGIDCVNYSYGWETPTLSCETGKVQLRELGNDEVSLGRSYIILSGESADENDMGLTVRLLGEVNSDYDFEIVRKVLDAPTIDESKKANSYNKSTLQAALDSR